MLKFLGPDGSRVGEPIPDTTKIDFKPGPPQCVTPAYLECLVDASAEHEELNGGGEVVEPLEELGHHLGPVMAEQQVPWQA